MNIVTNKSLERFYNNLNEDIKNKIGSSVPLGTILPYAGEIVPYSYLICDGSELNIEDYPDLFNIIGTSYGSSSSTTFKLPDFRGKVATGLDESQDEFKFLGITGGEKTHTLSENEMPSHNHGMKVTLDTDTPAGNIRDTVVGGGAEWNAMDWNQIQARGGSQPHNNLQPYIVTNYIIKVKYDDFEIQNKNQYSLEEHIIGVWYDSKPLYRKTLKFNSPYSLPSNIENLYEITDMRCVIKAADTQDQGWRNLPWLYYETKPDESLLLKWHGGFYYSTSDDSFKFQLGDYIKEFEKGYITVEYTKTID